MTTERHLLGPRPGAHGFGSFCRNKRTSARGAETPQEPLSFCHSRKLVPDVSNRGSSVLMNPVSLSLQTEGKEKTLDPRSGRGL